MLRRLTISIFVIAAVAGGLGLVGALATLDASVVRVAGDLSDAENRQVRDAVAAALTRPGLPAAADVVAAVEALGWVREVQVRRHWPDALHVWVQRETVVAHWWPDAWLTTGGNVVLAVPGGEQPHVTAQELASLPTFHASAASGPDAMHVFALLNDAARADGLRVIRLDEDENGTWTATFANGGRVVLGGTDIHERFTRFATVYRAALQNALVPFEQADARYDAGVAVRWRTASEGGLGPAMTAKLAAALSPSQVPTARYAFNRE